MTDVRPGAPLVGWASPPTGVAVIGCGYWGLNHVRVFEQLVDSNVVVACDRDAAQVARVTQAFPHLRVSTDVDEALATPGVEAAVIATNAATHADLATRALDAGLHVLVEKPLTADSVAAVDLIDLAEKRGRVLLVGHTFLYNAGVRKVKEYVDRDAVYYMYARRTNLGPIRRDVNAVWDLAPHDVSIFNYLLDDTPEWVSAVGVGVLDKAREDVAFISIGYGSGVVGHIHVSWADPHKVREVIVVSSERRIVFNDVDPIERVRVYDKGVKFVPIEAEVGAFGEHRLLLRDGDITSPAIRASEPLRNMCGHFLHCVRRGESPVTSGSDGLAVICVLEAIERSMAAGGARTEVGRMERVLR